jgi:hypothetical protein
VAYEDITHSGFQSYHRELEFHFYWIWTYYSTDIAEYARDKFIGTDKGIIDAGIRNVYYDSETCKDRIISLINDTKDILWIRGVSLRSFFMPGGEIYDALRRKYVESGSDVDIRIILIDMASESARKRSYREYKINDGPLEYGAFNERIYEEQKLYADTKQTLNYIEIFQRECDRITGGKKKNRIEVRVSGEDPEGFFFFTDRSVLVEQYHFGKLKQDSSGQKLGGEVPVFEFVDNGRAKQYTLYKSHFKYLFGISREPPRREI